MRGVPISWKSSKQTSVALSSTEAEYMAQASAATNVMWARGILNEMDIQGTVSEKTDTKDDQPIIIYADNQRAIKLTNNPVFQRRIKHIAVKYHYIRDLIDQEQIKLEYRPTMEMIADDLTKPLGSMKFQKFVNQLEMATKR